MRIQFVSNKLVLLSKWFRCTPDGVCNILCNLISGHLGKADKVTCTITCHCALRLLSRWWWSCVLLSSQLLPLLTLTVICNTWCALLHYLHL